MKLKVIYRQRVIRIDHLEVLALAIKNKKAMRPWNRSPENGLFKTSFSANGNIIKTNFLTKFQAAQVKNIISIVLTRLFYNLT